MQNLKSNPEIKLSVKLHSSLKNYLLITPPKRKIGFINNIFNSRKSTCASESDLTLFHHKNYFAVLYIDSEDETSFGIEEDTNELPPNFCLPEYMTPPNTITISVPKFN